MKFTAAIHIKNNIFFFELDQDIDQTQVLLNAEINRFRFRETIYVGSFGSVHQVRHQNLFIFFVRSDCALLFVKACLVISQDQQCLCYLQQPKKLIIIIFLIVVIIFVCSKNSKLSSLQVGKACSGTPEAYKLTFILIVNMSLHNGFTYFYTYISI